MKDIQRNYALKIRNSMEKWEKNYLKDILKDVRDEIGELTRDKIPLIMRETSFKIRKGKYSNRCPYYKTLKSCHPENEDLNCLLCSCPDYDTDFFKEDKKILIGRCKRYSKEGKYYFSEKFPDLGVWDCSDCNMNHSHWEVKRYLEENFYEYF